MVVYYMKYSKYIVSVGVRYWEGHTIAGGPRNVQSTHVQVSVSKLACP